MYKSQNFDMFNNPFVDMYKQFMDKNEFMNMQKNFSNFDMSQCSDVMKQNMDATMKASQVSAQNTQAIMKRAGEIAQKQIGEAIEAGRDVTSSQNPEQAMQKQQQYISNLTSKSLANQREMLEMASKSIMEVYDIFSNKFNENMNNVSSSDSTKKNK